MKVTRRGFLKISDVTFVASGIGISLKPIAAHAQLLKIKYAKETTTICPYYAVGCGIIVATRKDKVINMEGDPDHPINKGALCTKGGSIYQLDRPLYRAPYSTKWKAVSWNWAIDRIAKNVKKSRDKSVSSTKNS